MREEACDAFRRNAFGIFVHFGPSSLHEARDDQAWLEAVDSEPARDAAASAFAPEPDAVGARATSTSSSGNSRSC